MWKKRCRPSVEMEGHAAELSSVELTNSIPSPPSRWYMYNPLPPPVPLTRERRMTMYCPSGVHAGSTARKVLDEKTERGFDPSESMTQRLF